MVRTLQKKLNENKTGNPQNHSAILQQIRQKKLEFRMHSSRKTNVKEPITTK